jgi:hypothetical protein
MPAHRHCGWIFGLFPDRTLGTGLWPAGGPRQRRPGIDRDDAAMGDGAAQDHRMQQARPGDVVHIFALAAQEPQILDALDRAATRAFAVRFDPIIVIARLDRAIQ